MASVLALHIILVVCWFAGLFYIVRIFIYQSEAALKDEPEKSILVNEYIKNARKLWYGITWPGAIGTAIFGLWMAFNNFSYYFEQPWFYLKLVLVALLYTYHILCHMLFKQLQKAEYKYSSFQLRLFNEVATVFLVGIVFLVVGKTNGSLVWSMLGLVIFSSIIMAAVYLVKKNREKKDNNPVK